MGFCDAKTQLHSREERVKRKEKHAGGSTNRKVKACQAARVGGPLELFTPRELPGQLRDHGIVHFVRTEVAFFLYFRNLPR